MSDWQLITDIIREMHESGHDVMFGPHAYGLYGYYACFFKADDMPWCEHCDQIAITWIDCGHGETLLEAIEMARAIALKLDVDIPPSEDFLL
jgi:hypothetical protein